jgi:hypothetical protein
MVHRALPTEAPTQETMTPEQWADEGEEEEI